MAPEPEDGVVDSLTLRFVGKDEDGNDLHELRAAHVAEVLLGLVGLTSDFSKAGAFGEGPAGSEVLVRPPQEGSFIIEVVRFIQDNAETASALGVPSLGTIVWWATKSMRADVKDISYLDNGNVKITWQDDTVNEVPAAVWRELNLRKRRRKKQLRQIMAPMSDPRVTAVQVEPERPLALEATEPEETAEADETYVLTRPDYDAVRPEDEIEERHNIFPVEAQMSAVNFDDPTKWRVKTKNVTRNAVMEDKAFLARVASGLAIRKSDIFQLKVREDAVEKNGRTRRTWTVLQVLSHRRAATGDDT